VQENPGSNAGVFAFKGFFALLHVCGFSLNRINMA
jgi:hypothetical protein